MNTLLLSMQQRQLLLPIMKQKLKTYPYGKAPDAIGLINQGLQDDESTFAGLFDVDRNLLAGISYRVHRNYVKVMNIGSLQKGAGQVLLGWLESRFRRKDEIRLWASPSARDWWERMGYEKLAWGYYRKRLTLSKTPVRIRTDSGQREQKRGKVLDNSLRVSL